MFESMERYDDGWEPVVPLVAPPDPAEPGGTVECGVPDDPAAVGMCVNAVEMVGAMAALDDIERTHAAGQVDRLDAEQTLAEAAATVQAERQVRARQLQLAAHWADLHGVLDTPRSLPGGERLVRLGGDGTPPVAEFAAAELGAVFGVSDAAASRLVADALDLRHRFPRLWHRLSDGELPVWTARRVAERTRPLTKTAAASVDARICTVAGSVPWRRLSKVVEAAMLAVDPPQAMSDAENAAAETGVWVNETVEHGYGSMFVKAAAGDLKAFDQALDVISRALKILGDPDSPDQRRAKAVGILANPHTAQDLVTRADATRKAAIEAAAARRAGNPDAGEQIEQKVDRSPCLFSSATLYYHLTKQQIDAILNGQPHASAEVVRVDDVGPVIADQVRRWLGHNQVSVTPVLDVPGMPAVDRYEIPPKMAEAVGLEKPADHYPYATSLSRHQDNDHTIPYVPMPAGGPPGQTDRAKIGKLTRRHHRIKTFAGWTVTQPRSGTWLWRTPHRHYYLVDHTGTTALGKL